MSPRKCFVFKVLGTLRRLGLDKLLHRRRHRRRDLAAALIAARLLDPRSKLATGRAFRAGTAASSLGEVLELAAAGEDDLYDAILLAARPPAAHRMGAGATASQRRLAGALRPGFHLLRRRPMSAGAVWHSRDQRSGNLRIVFGLLINGEGCPVAVEVFEVSTPPIRPRWPRSSTSCASVSASSV